MRAGRNDPGVGPSVDRSGRAAERGILSRNIDSPWRFPVGRFLRRHAPRRAFGLGAFYSVASRLQLSGDAARDLTQSFGLPAPLAVGLRHAQQHGEAEWSKHRSGMRSKVPENES